MTDPRNRDLGQSKDEQASSEEATVDISRRGFIKTAGKAAYVAPTITVLTLAPIREAAASDGPPLPPELGQ